MTLIQGLTGSALASLFNPKLTTIRQPAYEMGSRAFEILLQRMTKPENPSDCIAGETLVLDTALIVRSSTGPAKKYTSAPPGANGVENSSD